MSSKLSEIVSKLSASLEDAPLLAMGAIIQDVLIQIGEEIGADRAYIFTFSEADDTLDNVLEWCRPGIQGMQSENRAVPSAHLPWLMDQLSRRTCVAIDDVADLPKEAEAEKADFESQQIRSLIVMPLRHNRRLMGLIGFDMVQTHCQWSNKTQQELSLVPKIIAEALYRDSVPLAFTQFASQARKFMAPLPGMVFQCEVDSSGTARMPFVCEQLERFFGISSETLQHTAKPLLDRVHPKDLTRVMAEIGRSMRQVEAFEAEFRVRADDGSMRWMRGNAMPESLPDGILWHGYLVDVTDRVAAEQVVIDQGLWTQTILENIDDAIFSIDQQGIIQTVNRSAEKLFGYSTSQMTGENISIIMPEPHRSRHDGYIDRYLRTGKARVMGFSRELEARRSDGSLFPIELQVTQINMNQSRYFIGVVRDITQRKRSEKEIHRLAYYDPLTDLPNRRLLIDRMEQVLAVKGSPRMAILSMDLDNFKDLNDSLGHFMGDRYLEHVSQRLQSRASDNITMAHIGGDEFVVLMTELNEDPETARLEAERFADEIRQELSTPLQLAAHDYSGTFSIGIALAHEYPKTVEELLKQADIALHQAKSSAKKNTVRTFSEGMQDEVEMRVQFEGEIRRALEQNQFALHYQPQVQADGSVSSVEALVRWHHPVKGLIPPGKFISVCEVTGLIIDLGNWVIEAACEQLVRWSADDTTSHLRVAVNISMRQFHEQDFVAQVLAALERTGAPAQQLELEMTESLFVEDMDDAIEKMKALRERGVRFSLDDFGTGYSSLSYLKRLPLNQLKIDQSFVQDIDDDGHDLEIARMIVALADTMNLEVIAEGVETRQQRQVLESIGCSRYQGFLFAKPMPAENLLPSSQASSDVLWAIRSAGGPEYS